MDFGLSDEQQLLQRTIRDYLAAEVPITRVRELVEAEPDATRTLWRSLAELGAAGIGVPEEHGGTGLGLLDTALVAEELGRAVVPSPFLGTVLASEALLAAGSPAQQASWLPKIATGDVACAAALTERVARREDAGIAFRDGKLEGKALVVLDLPGAELVLVASDASDLLLVPTDAAGVHVEALTAIDRTRRTAEIVFAGAEPAECLDADAQAIDRVLDVGRIVLAAEIVGAAESMIDQAVAYAKERTQFGRVIGSFQAVKHLCAEMVAELEPARSLLWFAAHALGEGLPEADRMVAHAKAHLSEIGREIAKTSTEVHGGVGFTDEQNLHFWFKRIGTNRALLGLPDYLRERAAQLGGLV